MTTDTRTTASAAFAAGTQPQTRFKRSVGPPLRHRAIMTLAAICYISILTIGSNNDDGMVAAFSTSCHHASPSIFTVIHGVNSVHHRKSTRLAYKHLENDDENDDAAASRAAYNANKNETVLNTDNVIYYNDLEDVVAAFSSSNNYNVSSIASSSQSSIVGNNDSRSNDDLIHELQDTIKQNKNWKTKITQRNTQSTANYLESLSASTSSSNDTAYTDHGTSDNDDIKNNKDLLRALRDQQANITNSNLLSTQQAFLEATRRTHPKEAIEKRIEDVRSKPQWRERSNVEREQLEGLYVEREDAKKKNRERFSEERERWRRGLLEGWAQERNEEKIAGEEEDEAVLLPDQSKLLENESSNKGNLARSRNEKCGIPILDILSRQSVVDNAPPLLVGTTLTFVYSDLTPFQKRALDVARGYHEEHCERMEVGSSKEELDQNEVLLPMADDEGGILGAAPIIAIIDNYTASVMESLLLDPSSPQKTAAQVGRYATLASVEMVECNNDDSVDDNDGELYSAVKLAGVGRVFLHDYFSSKDTGLTNHEEELSKLLARIQEFDRQEQYGDKEETIRTASEHDNEDDELPVVMAEFDLFLDNSSILSDSNESSSKHSEDVTEHRTEVYRTANKVYRLHEERKQLVAGLRAGVARLQVGKKERAEDDDDNCLVDFQDCDGLGFIGGVLMDGDCTTNDNFEEETLPAAAPALELSENVTSTTPRSILETMDNYGFGSYGTLSTIPDLTTQLILHLEPYYSPTHREREEYNAEVASMVIFRTLEEYATPQELAMALLAPSSMERLELGYSIMIRHVGELKDLVKIVSDELMGCGEECTDLW